MNPYAQGGWSNSYNPNAVNNPSWGTSPSLYGALPYSTPPLTTPELTFTFSVLDGTILNSRVFGPKSRTYFRISTDSASSGFTVVQNSKLESVALIEWRSHPIVEITNIVSKRGTSQWLALSPDKTHRIMGARGRGFRWVPSQGYIELYSTGVPTPQLFGRISQDQSGVKLELTGEAVHIGLLEVCVTSAVLLMSGRNID
ncbi:hypothetical protein DFH08DRAFT_686377 [Mycena albidolilacea]|uniref:DUF6593 domain-containing protein n=1 Tax=Mycena albidolilacea TaxID=1033008 RepID=A0AAD7F0Z1_9AGAR|nr:hypothetical protein DFH08DRAFT_686377 [Mycena albidolilacea]